MSNSGLDGTTIYNNGRPIVTSSRHETSRHILVASRNRDIAVIMLGLYRLNILRIPGYIKSKTPYQNNLNFQLRMNIVPKCNLHTDSIESAMMSRLGNLDGFLVLDERDQAAS